jgi:aminoglycoside-2''-adenylyltransferase
MDLEEDLREFVELLNALNVRYMVVGAFAVAYHGYPRFTGDIDLFIERSRDNAERLVKVIEKFGFGELNLSANDFLKEDQVIQIGISPNRIDLLTFLSGITFDEAWPTREHGEINGLKVPFISKELLKRNKAASGRTQDLADLENL